MIKNQYTHKFQTYSNIYYSVAKSLWYPSTDIIQPNICCLGQWKHFAQATCNIQSLFLSFSVLAASFLLSQKQFMASTYVSHNLMMRRIQHCSEGLPSPQSHSTLILKAVFNTCFRKSDQFMKPSLNKSKEQAQTSRMRGVAVISALTSHLLQKSHLRQV